MTTLFWSERSATQARRPFGRALVAAGLAHLGAAPSPVVVGLGGKPRLATGELHFNISHTSRLSVCAISASRVGVDVESTLRPAPAELPTRFFTVAELAELSADPSRFLPLFTRKEAWTKLKGFGIGVGLGHFDTAGVLAANPEYSYSTFDLAAAVCTVWHAAAARPVVRHVLPISLGTHLQEAV